jgi:hypothetical protein
MTMGEGAEYLTEQTEGDYFVRQMEKEDRENRINETTRMLRQKSNSELIEYLCGIGPSLNTLSSFKTYDVAKRIKDNGWTPTRKQRDALINTAAIALNYET